MNLRWRPLDAFPPFSSPARLWPMQILGQAPPVCHDSDLGLPEGLWIGLLRGRSCWEAIRATCYNRIGYLRKNAVLS
jgi:hypothetical protein